MRFEFVTIQMKATEQKCFCSTVCYAVQGDFNALVWGRNSASVTIQMKAIGQYFIVVLFIMLYKVVLTIESVDKILKCDHSNESY